jgi:hypothetical protein
MDTMISNYILVDKFRNLNKGSLNLIKNSPIVLFSYLPPEEKYCLHIISNVSCFLLG